ncbi:MAG: hypothetical protein ACHBN1_27215 [Heteroscytonema crispum UTEX LB 1556]
MEANKKDNRQMAINDLIQDAITNAVTRRGLVEKEQALLGLSDEEAARIAGGLTSGITAEKLKPINPICPPTKPTPIKPICPPFIAGLIAPAPRNDAELA